jgi:hypothetical protein
MGEEVLHVASLAVESLRRHPSDALMLRLRRYWPRYDRRGTLLKGWVTPEEWLYPTVQTALSAWTRSNRPHHEVVRVVGERWSPRSHQLRDALTRNTVPIGFYAVESDEGRRLVNAYNLDLDRLPAVILYSGSVLYSPSVVEVAAAIGVHTTPSRDLYDVAIIRAGPAGLAAGVYGASEGLRTIVVESESIGVLPVLDNASASPAQSWSTSGGSANDCAMGTLLERGLIATTRVACS